MKFYNNKLVFYMFNYNVQTWKSISDVGYATPSLQIASRNWLHYPLRYLNYREHTTSLQKDGTQIPFHLISEIKKKRQLQPLLQMIKTSSDQISFSVFKNLFKELKKYKILSVFSGSFLRMPLLLAGTSMLQYSCLCG